MGRREAVPQAVARRLARRGARITGVDLSGGMIAHARVLEEAHPLGIAYRVASFSDHTGLADASFDRAVSTMALMDAPDLEDAMREAHRLLRPGGVLASSVLHPCFVTPGLRWEHDEAGRTMGLIVLRYFDRTAFAEEWSSGARPQPAEGGAPVEPFAVPRFPHTLSDWVSAIAGAGFRIAAIEEPRPDDAAAPGPKFARPRDLAAFVLMVQATRN